MEPRRVRECHPKPPAWLFATGFPVNELAMNFPSQRIDHGYLKVLVVAETFVAEVLGEHPAVFDRFNVGVELNSNPVPQRNAIFHIEEKMSASPSPQFVLVARLRKNHRREAAI